MIGLNLTNFIYNQKIEATGIGSGDAAFSVVSVSDVLSAFVFSNLHV